MCPAMQSYTCLALVDNSEVGETVSSSSQPKEAFPKFAMGPSREDLLISHSCEVGGGAVHIWFPEGPIVRGPEMVLGYL